MVNENDIEELWIMSARYQCFGEDSSIPDSVINELAHRRLIECSKVADELEGCFEIINEDEDSKIVTNIYLNEDKVKQLIKTLRGEKHV